MQETGWKLVHGDVFRKPPHSKAWTYELLLAVCRDTKDMFLRFLGAAAHMEALAVSVGSGVRI